MGILAKMKAINNIKGVAAMNDEKYMQLALDEAKKGIGYVTPNPLVGAIIVKDGVIIGRGYHAKAGNPHAEAVAIMRAGDLRGATLYVTLEPCSHYGKTPPCVDAILAAGIKTVVIGSEDPNPLVSSVEKMRQAGIDVRTDILRDECEALNAVFFHYIRTQLPYIVLKYAMTLDGKLATKTGASKWITSDIARHHVHEWRHALTGIMTGIGTILIDDPMLDCRIENGVNPIRIICDTNLRLPLHARVVKTAPNIPTWIASSITDTQTHEPYIEAGCHIIVVPKQEEHLDLTVLRQKLGASGIDSILLEGGATLNAAALAAGIVNKIHAYVAPKIFGGIKAPTPVAGLGVDTPNEAWQFGAPKMSALGDDILIECEVR